MATLVGKVGIVLKGDYNLANTYEILDAVSYNNGFYIAKNAVPANTPPTNTTYWQTAIDAESISPSGLNHNGIFRGQNMGTISSLAGLETFLASHDVANGTFNDLFLGDYITIQDGTYNAAWMVAGFGTEWNRGNTNLPTKNTLTLIPRTTLGNAKMNSTDTVGVSQNSSNPLYATTHGSETAKYQGYWGSDMAQITLPAVETALNTVLGTHLIERDIVCSDTINSAAASMAGAGLTGAATDSSVHAVKVSLMTEVQVFGSTVCSSSFHDIGEGDQQLPVFNFINHVAYSKSDVWLRSVGSSNSFVFARSYGSPSIYTASRSFGLRPLIVVG